MKIAVVGSREYPRISEVRAFVRELAQDTVIISGAGGRVDSAAVNEAKRLHMPYEVYPADWKRFGTRAGAIRNHTIVEQADEIVAFWDGKSKGTKMTIDFARRAGKPLTIYNQG